MGAGERGLRVGRAMHSADLFASSPALLQSAAARRRVVTKTQGLRPGLTPAGRWPTKGNTHALNRAPFMPSSFFPISNQRLRPPPSRLQALRCHPSGAGGEKFPGFHALGWKLGNFFSQAVRWPWPGSRVGGFVVGRGRRSSAASYAPNEVGVNVVTTY